jgi:radical SAM superfamily enzyme YgiQ (UPF0313 family)
MELIERIEALPKVKKVFIRSGIRYDYLMHDPDDSFFRKLVRDNVSGQLKVAPEHCCDNVLRMMGKPGIGLYDRFKEKYFKITKELGKEQYLVPYLMSSHPGSTLNDAVELALYLKKWGYTPEQVQDFYPTPGTASTVMYYTGIDPLTGKKVYTATDYHEKQLQRALLQWGNPKNADLVREALRKCGREELIGFGGDCLVKPERQQNDRFVSNGGQKSKAPSGRKNARPSSARNASERKNSGKKNTTTVKYSKNKKK